MIEHSFSTGYYRVGQQIFLKKIPALIEGTKTNIHPEWVFHDQTFGLVNWEEEPKETLDDLYQQRAQQIRDRYDYVVLFYSGGSDSHNILNAFVKNNIKKLRRAFIILRAEGGFDSVSDSNYTSVLFPSKVTKCFVNIIELLYDSVVNFAPEV